MFFLALWSKRFKKSWQPQPLGIVGGIVGVAQHLRSYHFSTTFACTSTGPWTLNPKETASSRMYLSILTSCPASHDMSTGELSRSMKTLFWRMTCAQAASQIRQKTLHNGMETAVLTWWPSLWESYQSGCCGLPIVRKERENPAKPWTTVHFAACSIKWKGKGACLWVIE